MRAATPRLLQIGKRVLGNLVARLEIDLAGLFVDHVFREVLTDQVFVADAEFLDAGLIQAPREAGGHLLAGLGDDLAVFRVDEIPGELGAEQPLGLEIGLPTVLVAVIGDRIVEIAEQLLDRHAVHLFGRDFLAAGRALDPQRLGLLRIEREQERGDRKLPPPVDADMDQVPWRRTRSRARSRDRG